MLSFKMTVPVRCSFVEFLISAVWTPAFHDSHVDTVLHFATGVYHSCELTPGVFARQLQQDSAAQRPHQLWSSQPCTVTTRSGKLFIGQLHRTKQCLLAAAVWYCQSSKTTFRGVCLQADKALLVLSLRITLSLVLGASLCLQFLLVMCFFGIMVFSHALWIS